MHTVVPFIYRKIIVVAMVHCGLSPSLSCGHFCTCKISNTKEVTYAYLFHSVATQILCSKEYTFYFSKKLLELHFSFVLSLCLERMLYVS
jgi:hypothetical protein